VFIPADGTDKLYYYDHATRKQGYAGVSAMPLKVKGSRKEFDWSVNTPVEFRPYIKDIAGRKRLFFLGTISAKNEKGQFDGAATPDLALIDSEYRDVVWIDVKYPSSWDEAIYKQLNEAWRASEDIGYYYDEAKMPADQNKNFGIEETYKIMDSLKAVISKNESQKTIEALQQKIDSIKALGN
jgi:hypothetical protein